MRCEDGTVGGPSPDALPFPFMGKGDRRPTGRSPEKSRGWKGKAASSAPEARPLHHSLFGEQSPSPASGRGRALPLPGRGRVGEAFDQGREAVAVGLAQPAPVGVVLL